MIHYEKMKTAEEKFPEGLNIFIVYFKLKCFEYNMIFHILSGCIYSMLSFSNNIIMLLSVTKKDSKKSNIWSNYYISPWNSWQKFNSGR